MAEPVAWMDAGGRLYQFPDDADRGQTMRPLYLEQPTHPTKLLGPNLEQVLNSAGFYKKREWVNLTDDEIKEIIGSWGDTPVKGYTRKLMDQIQDKLKEKNT